MDAQRQPRTGSKHGVISSMMKWTSISAGYVRIWIYGELESGEGRVTKAARGERVEEIQRRLEAPCPDIPRSEPRVSGPRGTAIAMECDLIYITASFVIRVGRGRLRIGEYVQAPYAC